MAEHMKEADVEVKKRQAKERQEKLEVKEMLAGDLEHPDQDAVTMFKEKYGNDAVMPDKMEEVRRESLPPWLVKPEAKPYGKDAARVPDPSKFVHEDAAAMEQRGDAAMAERAAKVATESRREKAEAGARLDEWNQQLEGKALHEFRSEDRQARHGDRREDRREYRRDYREEGRRGEDRRDEDRREEDR